MNVTGFNHITLKVSDLVLSLAFYEDVLGMKLVHRGRTDVYLEWGGAWICLVERPVPDEKPHTSFPSSCCGMDHVAFSIGEEDFDAAVHKLKRHQVNIVRGPVERGGGRCVNFLDPDGIQLELNTGNLAGRMEHWK
ncbi:VOC family protein [Paenibacillus hamazuiensis]|uniref:VOC family protein n=1 Tax=Paenibacillus hamazuiensis TaxID=2936508 RepID=UPI00200E5436|nr:VOC family protein [Paenibacillus hamazuiensis]